MQKATTPTLLILATVQSTPREHAQPLPYATEVALMHTANPRATMPDVNMDNPRPPMGCTQLENLISINRYLAVLLGGDNFVGAKAELRPLELV